MAAVFVPPPNTPQREILILIALVVTAGTLLLQGSSLPWLVRRLRLPGPDRAADTLAEAELLQRSAREGIAELDRQLTGDEPHDVVERLRRRGLDARTPCGNAWVQPLRRRARSMHGCAG